METSIKLKRETMQLCNKLIPMMNKKEINQIALVLNGTTERLIKEGRVSDK